MIKYVDEENVGLVPAKEMPDVGAVASDLKEKGYTGEQVRGMVEKLGLNSNATSEILTFFKEDVGAEEEQQTPTPLNPEIINTRGASPFRLPPPEFPSFGFSKKRIQAFSPKPTEASKMELSFIASRSLPTPPLEIKQYLDKGDMSPLQEAGEIQKQEAQMQKMAVAEKEIQDAGQPQDVLNILSDLNKGIGRPATLMQQRAAYNQYLSDVKSPAGVSTESIELSPILKHTIQNNLLSMEVAKRQQEYELSLDYFDVWFKDFPELLSTTAGVSQEYFKNYATDIYNSLDKLETLSPEKQITFVNTLIDQAIKQETFLFNNNNSFMASGQIDTIYKAISQGAALQANGATEAEVRSKIESVVDATLYATELGGIVKSIGGLAKFLMRRIHSGSVLKDVMSEQERLIENIYREEAVRRLSPTNAQYIAEETITEPSLVKMMGDKRERLQKLASQKGTRKERKALEKEKRDLGARLYELENKNVNKEARELTRSKKAKFKEARKEVESVRNAEIETIKRRQKTNQELINDFDKRAKAEADLSRIDTFLRQGRIQEGDLLEEIGAIGVSQVQERIVRPVIYRENYTAFDTQLKFNPEEQVKMENTGEGGLKGIVEATGMTAEDVAQRAIMTPTEDGTTSLRNTGDRSMVTDAQLIDASEEEIGSVLGRELEKPMGTSLRPIYADTKVKANDIEDSYGTFTFRLADGQKAFDTAEEAEDSIKAAATGYDYEIVKADEGYYVDVSVDHYLNPYADSSALLIKNPTPSDLASVGLNNARLVEEDLIRGLFAIKGVNKSIVHKLEEKAKEAVGSLNIDETALLSDILKAGDTKEVEWGSIQSIFKDTGLTVPKNVFKSYRELREINEEIFVIRERNYYNRLRRENMKYIKMGDGKVLGKPVKIQDVEAEELFDSRTGAVVKKENIKDGVVVQLKVPNEISEGKELSYAVVNGGDVSSLTRGFTLTRRDGHIDRMYRDAGWTVSVNKTRNIDGKDVVTPKVTHIVQTEAQAIKIAKKLEADGKDVLPPQRSRENAELEDIFSDSESVQFGYGASHLRKRGELVKGSDGISDAPTLDVFESLYKSINGAQSALDYNAFQSAKVKFLKGFAPYLKNENFQGLPPFKSNLDEMLSASAKQKMPKDLYKEMQNHHAYLKTLLQNQKHGFYKKFDAIFQPITGIFNKTADTQKAAVLSQKAATEMYIVWNGIYQAEQNFLPVMWTIATGGTGGIQAVRQLNSLRKALKGDLKPLISSFDGNEELAKKLVVELKNNGLVDAVGRMDDFLDLARSEGAGVSVKKGVSAGAKAVKGGLYDFSREKLISFQESTIVLNNVFAYLTEFNTYVAKTGGKFDGKGAAEVSFQAQKRTQTQNSMDKFAWQSHSNPVSLFTQFFQAIYKGTLDWVIEPHWEVMRSVVNPVIKPILKREMGHLGKNVGRISDSVGKAWMASLVTWVMFGPEGALGRKFGTMLEDSIREQYQNPEDIPVVLDAMLDGMLSTAINEVVFGATDVEFDATATMSPAAMIDIITELASDMSITPVSTFAVGGLINSVYNTITTGISAAATEEIDFVDFAGVAATELLTNLKIVDSTHKAFVTYWTGRNASSRTLSSEIPLDTMAAVGKIFGLQEEMQSDYFYRQDFFTKVERGFEPYITANIDAGLRAYAMEAVTIKSKMAVQAGLEGKEVNPTEELHALLKARAKWAAHTKFISPTSAEPDIDNAFLTRSINFDPASPEIFLKPYIEKGYEGNRAIYLRSINQRAPEKFQKDITVIRKAQEILEGTDKNNG